MISKTTESNNKTKTSTLRDNRKFGFFIIENKLFDDGTVARIGPHAFTVYGYLVKLTGNGNECYPKIDTICSGTGISRPTVIRAVNTLIENKLISRTRTKTVNHYTIEHTSESKKDLLSGDPQSKTETPAELTSDTPLLTIQIHNNKNIVEQVFENWKKITDHPRAVLDRKRETRIKEALKNYQPEDLEMAFRGCILSPFHMGENDRKQKYDELTLILRDAEHIERFIYFCKNPPKKPAPPTNPDSRPRRPLS